jgi:Mg2+ and Co2+ transporter CorA
MTQTNNEINDILSKLTALGSVLIPMNLVTGLWGMNVQGKLLLLVDHPLTAIFY